MEDKIIKPDHKIIFDIVKKGSKVLDLGCGDGELLYDLVRIKDIKAEGVELDEEDIYSCIEKGLSVYHRDIENGLKDYPDNAFDYVILNQIIQEIRNMEFLLNETLRVGRKVIIGFPNFAYIKARFDLFFRGTAPVTSSLPYQWYNSPNIHFGSLKDFKVYCTNKNIKILKAYYLGKENIVRFLPNIFAVNGIFLVEKKHNI
ncbi:MAG: methionine biosynthesis protein MetW, partial [Actinobacteria bacterium]|nr:methionine biosynthesis protein MetW [Actinomycetota bacterium]